MKCRYSERGWWMENRGETYGGRTDIQRERKREIDSATFGRSFVQVALEHQSRIIPLRLFFIPLQLTPHSTCNHSLHTSNPQPRTNMGFDFLKPPSATNSKPSATPPPRTGPVPLLFHLRSLSSPQNSLSRSLTLPLDKLPYTTRFTPPLGPLYFSVFVLEIIKNCLCHAQCRGISSTRVNCYSRAECSNYNSTEITLW